MIMRLLDENKISTARPMMSSQITNDKKNKQVNCEPNDKFNPGLTRSYSSIFCKTSASWIVLLKILKPGFHVAAMYGS